MRKATRIPLIFLTLLIIVPAYPRAEKAVEEGSHFQADSTGFVCGDNTSLFQEPGLRHPAKVGGGDSLSWEGAYEPVLEAGPEGSWDDSAVIGPEVFYTGRQYRMWYSGVSGMTRQIGHANSVNGITWEKSPENPVLSVGEPGSWDEERVWAPAVIYHSSIWKMWYVGYSEASGSQIGFATSEDGLHWDKYWGNPVFSPGIFYEWESAGVISPEVVFEDGIYHMWYTNDDQGYIGYAASPDGIHWEKYPENPIIQPSGGEDENCSLTMYVSPSVVHLDEYHMWYQAGESCRGGVGGFWIVHSISPDRVTWSEPEWTFGYPSQWDAHYPTVISHHNGLDKQMWYASCGKIYFAEESDLNLRNYLPLTGR